MGVHHGSAISCNAETWVQSLDWEDPPEKEILASILAWEIPWIEETGRL